MAKKPKPKPDDSKQSQRFIKTARKLGAYESGKAFENALGILKNGGKKRISINYIQFVMH